jgi:hypothetical protein
MLSVKWGSRWGLLSVIGGVISYLGLSVETQNLSQWQQFGDPIAPFVMLMLGFLQGGLADWCGGSWKRESFRKKVD